MLPKWIRGLERNIFHLKIFTFSSNPSYDYVRDDYIIQRVSECFSSKKKKIEFKLKRYFFSIKQILFRNECIQIKYHHSFVYLYSVFSWSMNRLFERWIVECRQKVSTGVWCLVPALLLLNIPKKLSFYCKLICFFFTKKMCANVLRRQGKY